MGGGDPHGARRHRRPPRPQLRPARRSAAGRRAAARRGGSPRSGHAVVRAQPRRRPHARRAAPRRRPRGGPPGTRAPARRAHAAAHPLHRRRLVRRGGSRRRASRGAIGEAREAAVSSVQQTGETDRELLRRYHEGGDATAREILVERHLPLVRSLARRYAGRGEVLEALEAGSAYAPLSLSAGPGGEDELDPMETIGSEDEEFDRTDDRTSLEPALAALPQREQEILRMRFEDGLTQTQIAEQVGISQMHVPRLIRRSLEP